MIREKIIVPSGIRYISDWNEFNLVFQATIIEVNKENKLVIKEINFKTI